MSKIALITGATAGIGYATAELLAENEFNLIITGRRKQRLKSLRETIQSKNKNIDVLILDFDIREKQSVFNAIDNLSDEWEKIDVLINNAGLASGLEPLQTGDIDDWEKMIDTNIKGLLYITRAVSPLMIKRGNGHIVNIGSIAGKEVYPNGNIYCATKHAVDALTKGMRIDMLPHGIKVSQIAPGMVETEFSMVRFHGDQTKANQVYTGFQPLKADDIADAILYVVTRSKHVCINDLIIMPTVQASATNIIKES